MHLDVQHTMLRMLLQFFCKQCLLERRNMPNRRLLQLDEIGRRFTAVGGSLQLLSREIAVMTKKLEQLLQQ
jgi:hypothetical protein